MPRALRFPIARFALLMCVAAPSGSFAGCASGSAQQPPTAPSQAAKWSLTFHLSGGFGGFDRQLELTSSGAATVTDRRRNITRTGQASADELKTISQMVATATAADARQAGCADCFEYNLDVQGAGGRVTIVANDAGLSADAPPAALVRSLSQLLTRLINEGQV